MDPEKTMLQHMLTEYRQALADAQYALAQANARNIVLTGLVKDLEAATKTPVVAPTDCHLEHPEN